MESHFLKRNLPLLLLTALLSTAQAQHNHPDTLRAVLTQTDIQLDGRLSEEAWTTAPKISNFTQRELSEGDPASETTEIAVLYDSKNLYIGVWCYDSRPDLITARKMQRDFHWNGDDNIEIIIDTYHNHRDGYLFVTNPNGARADALILNNGQHFNKNWNGVWNVRTSRNSEGWFAEFTIPFSTLKFKKVKQQIWGINFERNIRRKHEQVMWQGWSRDAELEQIKNAGVLFGLKNLEEVNLIEIKPYALAGIQNESGRKAETNFNFGGDMNYLITPALKLNITANTDFAQVESDRNQINLSRFSLYYPEKREFFLEGKDYFDFGLGRKIQPFYSRRIGLDADGNSVPILGGARIMGKTGRATLGAMSIQTAQTDSSASTNFSVLRWKQDLGRESTIGLIGVGKFEQGHGNGVIGGDYLYSTSHFLKDKTLVTGGAYAQSFSPDSAGSSGSAQRLFVSYPSDFIEFDASWERSSKNFKPETGFLRRTNYQKYYAELQFNPRPAFLPFLRRLVFKPLDFDYYFNDRTGRLISFDTEFRPLGFSTKSGEWFEFNIQRSAENLEESFEIQEGFVIPAGEYWFTHYEVQLSTFSGRPFFGFASINWGDFFNGSRNEISGMLVWRMNRHVSLSYSSEYNYIQLPQGHFTASQHSGRIEYALSPDLFGLFFGQWNDEDQEVSVNLRLNWIPKPGTGIYFVVNQSYETGGKQMRMTNTMVLSKLVWRFTI